MGTLTAAMTFKLAPADALLKGFSNSGVVTVAALFPVAAGMHSTGAITLLSKLLLGRPKTLAAAQMKILPPIAIGMRLSEQHAAGRHDDPRDSRPGARPDLPRRNSSWGSVLPRFSAAP